LGNDTYVYDADGPLGADTLSDSDGTDTLDFSLTNSQRITIDLSFATAQAVNGNLILTLGSGSAFENIIGGDQPDRITGNGLANVLTGGGATRPPAGLLGNDTYAYDADGALGSDTLSDSGGTDTLDFSPTGSQ